MAVLKFRRDGAEVEVVGHERGQETLVDRWRCMTSPARWTT
jgi:hypothetical protein